ncbi:MAG: hypothetical protein J0L82_18430 [Deltaproteobacteria bacterium]|nr:hypothetical protein [Deltaproteobacteria bacterium]
MKTILQIIEDLIARFPTEVRAGFSKADFIRWLEAAGYPNGEFEDIFCEFKDLAERDYPKFVLDNGETVYFVSSGVKRGRRYSIEVGQETIARLFKERAKAKDRSASSSIFLPTAEAVDKFLSEFDLTIGGNVIGPNSLTIVKKPEDLESIPSQQMGCYFIFSTLTEQQIPNLSADDYACHKRWIDKDGLRFRCLYNGKGAQTRERLAVHLFNNSTREKVLNSEGGEVKVSGTGAMSLDVISEADVRILVERNQLDRNKHWLKKIEKSIRRYSHVRHHPDGYFLNGIDIREDKWSKVTWAVCTVETDSEFGKILIEEAFARKNGRPPLCRRHG